MADTVGRNVVLHNAAPESKAQVAVVSMPVPLGGPCPKQIGNLPTQVQPIGWWPAGQAGSPNQVRRQLMFASAEDGLPEEVAVGFEGGQQGSFVGPTATCEIVSKKNTGHALTEFNELVLRYGEREIGIQVGLRHAGELNWWQWVRMEELWSGPLCRAVRLGGFITVERVTDEHLRSIIDSKGQSPYIHHHNWLRGEIYAWIFSSGVVHMTCRHVNNHLFDHGRDLADVRPVIGFRTRDASGWEQTLDGTQRCFDLGEAVLDLGEAAEMVSPEHPGQLRSEDERIVYQPYDGITIFGDTHKRVRDDGFIVKTEDNMFPRGVARTLAFDLSLGKAPAAVNRLVVLDWWYALAGDMWPDRVLPAYDAYDQVVEELAESVEQAAAERPRCFDNAVLTREVWEGEIPYSQMLYYYRSGRPEFFRYALGDAYHIADIGFDHATDTMRMHNFPFGAIAQPLYRTVGMLFGYLETGDPYLLDCAETAANRYYWIDRRNWPRRSYGRDAGSVRSLIFLWDYTGKQDYLALAREALLRNVSCRRSDGSYGDQGGTVAGCGAEANEITKPWMALLANDAVIDYLSRRSDDSELVEAITHTAEFILNSQLKEEGMYFWGYQYAHGDNPGDPRAMAKDPKNYPRHPAGRSVSGYKARFLTFMTRLTGDPRYLAAWQRCLDTYWMDGGNRPKKVAYTTNKAVQNIPYQQAHTWNARLDGEGIRIEPVLTDWSPRIAGSISTPWGMLALRCWVEDSVLWLSVSSGPERVINVYLPGKDQLGTAKGPGEYRFALA